MKNVQVKDSHYKNSYYNTLERFISYYYQIESVLSLGVGNILEIGTGSKVVSSYLSRAGIKVTTCDFDTKVMPDVLGDIRRLPIENKTFDTVLACEILEHIPFEELDIALCEIKRVSKCYAIISIPYQSVYFEFVFHIPFIRKLFNRKFFDITIRIPICYSGFESSGQHYWEIDSNTYKMRIIREKILRHFRIIKEFSPVLNKYHYFFILKIDEGNP